MRVAFEFGDRSLAAGDPPLRIAVAGPTDIVQGNGEPIRVDKDSFRDVLSARAEKLLFDVPDHLASRPDRLPIELRIRAITDYAPLGLAAQIPELTRAFALRDQLAALVNGSLSYAHFESGLHAYRDLDAFAEALRLCQKAGGPKTDAARTPPAATRPAATDTQTDAAGPDPVDRILDMVGREQPSDTTTALSQLQDVISDIGGTRKREAVPDQYAAALAAAERVLSRQLDEILHHPQLQAHEAFWRGLKFLVDHTDFRRDIRIGLLAIDRDRFGECFREQLLPDEMTAHSDVPLGLVVMPLAVTNHPQELEQLQLLGEAAEALQVPVLLSASPALFQLSAGSDAARMPYPGGLLSRPEYDKWNALRDKDASRWLAVSFNRFLLRAPYGPSQRNSLDFAETISDPEQHVWGDPAWILASLITGSFARCGWPTEFTGIDNGALDGLTIYSVDTGTEREMQMPLEAMLSERLAEDLVDVSFIPLLCRPNRDSAYVLRAPMLHRAERYGDEAATAASGAMANLPYTLLASRIAQAISAQLPRLRSRHESIESIGSALGEFVDKLIAGSGHGASVEVTVSTDQAGAPGSRIDLRIRVGRSVLNGAEIPLSIEI